MISEEQQRQYEHELRSYWIGIALAALLTAAPFAAVGLDLFDTTTTLILIAVTAIIQVVVHFRFFLHIDLSRSSRDDLQLILFTTLIIILMVGGTIWILFNLRYRMM